MRRRLSGFSLIVDQENIIFIDSGNAQIAYDVRGGGEAGQDVVFIHAGVNDRHSWDAVIDLLTPRHRCVAFDQRRFGETRYAPQDGWSPVADALAVMDVVGMRRAVLVAGSMGGMRAVDLVLAHPERVAGLVLIGSGVRGAPDPELDPDGPLMKLVEQLDAAEERDDLDEVVRLEAHLWLDGPTAAEGRVGGEVRARFNAANRRAMEAPDPGEEAEFPDAWARLDEIVVPTLILTGRLDVEDRLQMAPLIAQRIPNADHLWLDGVAHVPQSEADEATLTAITEFVDSLSSAHITSR